ncbi:MAG TPA: BTAD domain-containing putative transcriptional regulator, partial [Gemmatimonadales bacterium]|nr:BTAD domain-containing putative transcriptional regulator [Gemmatimonadales bacterium]
MIELVILGVTELRRDGQPVPTVLAQPKRLALLAYLALAPDQSFRRRDTVAALLWPELDQEHARGSLRQALRFLRRELGDEVIRNRGEEEIGLDFSRFWCDAVACDRAGQDGDPDRAAELYRGDLLEGFFVGEAAPDFDRWIDEERLRLRARANGSWWARAEREWARGRSGDAVAAARRAVRLAPDDETGLCRLLRMLDESGDRAGAIAAYEEFARRLAAEYQAQPAAETQALIHAIRARTRPGPSAGADVTAPPPEAPPREASGGSLPAEATTRPPARTRRAVPVLVTVIIVLLTGYLVASRRPAESHAPAGVAVLPVVDLTGDTAAGYLAEAMTDELITDLARIRRLTVINRRT